MGSLSTGFGEQGFGQGGYGGSYSSGQPLPTSYYTSLITSEWQRSPKFMAMTVALLQPLLDLCQCLASFQAAFDLDTAEGVQLDMLGQVVGVSRTVAFVPSDNVSPVLDDPTYRLLITARIAWNQFSGNIAGIQALWGQLFPSGTLLISDFQDMTADIILTGSFSSIVIDLIENGYIVPRPQGVLYRYIFPILPVFGCDLSTAFVAGVDLGHIT
jgi:hypothetical protein